MNFIVARHLPRRPAALLGTVARGIPPLCGTVGCAKGQTEESDIVAALRCRF